ncbi:phosphatidylserine decarboxylase [Mycobacterium ostraviense]|uniref:Phosphatidylserine decarboxylase n=1 Tax=Mycobacterium ostraviense TaxID=2738409 RepID=A0A164DSV7_9MYCO|nr:phosphatidylserine decarboxylase [Mycobacterium ostraviense]KZS66472.1 phosphatidylserine decarboxylase [Mycobacterium ostraviense]UGT90146.1 phosphatidylserine decarboxylase [Mycobacterium ostraviense]
MHGPDSILTQLRDVLEKQDGLASRLERSLLKARDSAQAQLKPDLYEALDWPSSIDEYQDYLRAFIRWVPRQTDQKAWQKQEHGQRQAKEVSDRTAHFYFLVDQAVEGSAPQASDAFRGWMTDFTGQWGSFLDTAESFSPEILQSFIDHAPEYRLEESLVNGVPNMPSGWLTFNQFIARELNGGLRPIAEPATNKVVTSPADCIFQHAYDIDDDSNIPATTIKNTHKYGNIKQLIEGSDYAQSFAGGTFVHYMLPPSAYHRFHLPVSGVVREPFQVSGKVFMQVTLGNGAFQSSDSATSGYEFTQNRGVVTLDTSESAYGDIGVVAIVPVGMAHVSSVMLTAVAGKHMAKGEEFGYFQFGGSDIIVLFQPGANPEIDNSKGYRLVGTPIARCAHPKS